MNSFGHAEVVASGLTLLQPIIKNVQTDTMITLQPFLTPAFNKESGKDDEPKSAVAQQQPHKSNTGLESIYPSICLCVCLSVCLFF